MDWRSLLAKVTRPTLGWCPLDTHTFRPHDDPALAVSICDCGDWDIERHGDVLAAGRSGDDIVQAMYDAADALEHDMLQWSAARCLRRLATEWEQTNA